MKPKTDLVERCKQQLQKCVDNEDTEIAHIKADKIVCSFLKAVGFKDIACLYDKVQKWYS